MKNKARTIEKINHLSDDDIPLLWLLKYVLCGWWNEIRCNHFFSIPFPCSQFVNRSYTEFCTCMHVSIDFYLCKNDWKVESQFVGTDHLCSIVWFSLSIDRLLLFLSSSCCWMTFCSASFLFGDKEFKSMIPTFLPRNHCNQT